MNNTSAKRPCALITGASGGIGAALAESFARDGYDLALTASDATTLADTKQRVMRQANVAVRTITLDLTRPGAPAGLLAQINHAGITVDVLVNNAGLGLYGHFADTALDDELRMMQLNMQALTALTKLFLPSMLERGHGHILNMASLTAYQPGGPGMAVYYATKSYVLSFTKSLSVELRGSGVHVSAICPGPVATAFESRSGAGGTWLYRLPKETPEQIARAARKAIKSRRSVVIPGLLAKLLAFAGELPPRRIALEVNKWLLKTSDNTKT